MRSLAAQTSTSSILPVSTKQALLDTFSSTWKVSANIRHFLKAAEQSSTQHDPMLECKAAACTPTHADVATSAHFKRALQLWAYLSLHAWL
jgi:hypothetical protein